MSRRALGRWLRLAAVVGTLGAVTVMPAAADNGVDQITGNGDTASAVTVPWSAGLVGANNTTVVTPRDPNSPLNFMYADFQHLAVTVSQTQNLVHQAIKVSWTGFQTPDSALGGPDFLQIMQCYGDSNAGPDPEDCEYGSGGLLPGGTLNPLIGSRTGNVCAKNTGPNTTNPPGAADGSSPALGCDTEEPSSPDHIQPGSDGTTYSIPFQPVGGAPKIYGTSTSYYDQFNTNEVQDAATGSDGTGQDFFQTLTVTEAPGLGCGAVEANGQTRGCWLVVVPRGQYKPNGYKLGQGSNATGLVTDSPLGASNWAQRVQIHLGFNTVQTNCPIGSAKEREMVGTGLVSHAVFSWQLALNAAANCSILYGYSETPEATSTTQLSDTSGLSAGLAFTTIPIGSEATRETGDTTTGAGPPVVYAPVAVSAITFAFDVNLFAAGGNVLTPIKLTPRLLAKALTQSYKTDLVDWTGDTGRSLPDSPWADNNPSNILNDPEFRELNPEIPTQTGSGSALAPLITEDHSGVNQQVWQWILSDPSARSWLSGAPDENGMFVNRYYQALGLASEPGIDSYPRADPTCFNTGGVGEKPPGRCAIDLLPYVNDMEDGATHVRAANNPESPQWSTTALAPDGSTGWWVSNGVESAGTVFMWTITDSANLANYGLVPAELCDASGKNCVSPNTASVSAALASAQPDSTGLLHVDPANPGSGGYPLVDVTYAAVRTTESPDQLTDYARFIAYAAGRGQTPGVDPGQLPHGYLPLPATLQAQSQQAVAALLAAASPQPSGSGSAPPGATSGGQSNTGGAGATQSNTASGNTNSGPPSTKPLSAKPPVSGPVPALAANKTAAQTPGAVRLVLLIALIVGAVAALAGPFVRDPAWVANRWRRIRS